MTIRKPVVVVGSSNGSHNYGDDMMWLATVNALRDAVPEVPVVTDAHPWWLPPVGGVEVLPFMHEALLRYRMKVSKHRLLNKSQAALGIAVNRDALKRGIDRQEQLASGAATRGIETAWERSIGKSQGMVISGAGGLTDTFAVHAIAGWGMMIALAHRMGIPVIMLGQGVGPLDASESRQALRRSLERCGVVTTRDHASERLVREIAPGVSATATIDWAVLERPSPATDASVNAYLEGEGVGDFVAASLHDWRPAASGDRTQVANLMRMVAESAAARDCEVVLVPNCIGQQRSDDRIFMRAAAEGLPNQLASRVRSLPGDMTAFETRSLIAKAKGVFASRYHPNVFALAAGTPATGICYDDYYVQKHSGALDWYGESHRLHRLDDNHDLDWWIAGIEDGQERQRRLDRTDELRDDCVRPLRDWVAANRIE